MRDPQQQQQQQQDTLHQIEVRLAKIETLLSNHIHSIENQLKVVWAVLLGLYGFIAALIRFR